MISDLQEADYSTIYGRQIPIDYRMVVGVGVVMEIADLYMIYELEKDQFYDITVLDVVWKMDNTTYMCILASITIVVTLMTFVVMRPLRIDIDTYLKIVTTSWVYVLESFSNKMGVSPRRQLNRSLWLSMVMAIFVLVQGYISNKTTGDKMAVMPAITVNTVDQLLNKFQFSKWPYSW